MFKNKTRVFSFVRQVPREDNKISLVISNRYNNDLPEIIHDLTEEELKKMKLNLETCLEYINGI